MDVSKKNCVSLAGKGSPGCTGGKFKDAQFSEPSGLCLSPAGDTVYVADTNNHLIRTLDLATETVADVSVSRCGESSDSHMGWCVLPIVSLTFYGT